MLCGSTKCPIATECAFSVSKRGGKWETVRKVRMRRLWCVRIIMRIKPNEPHLSPMREYRIEKLRNRTKRDRMITPDHQRQSPERMRSEYARTGKFRHLKNRIIRTYGSGEHRRG